MQKKSKTTTIAVTREVHTRLGKLMKSQEDYNDVVSRLLNDSVDVYTEFILVDNELPQLHTIVFQLGDNKDSLYFYDGEQIRPITLAETQKMMKQPRPNMTITREEAQTILNWGSSLDAEYNSETGDKGDDSLTKRLKEFLGQTKNEFNKNI